MIRWGILGAGRIAAVVGADIVASPGSTVAAVGARDAGRAAELAALLGAGRSYGSYAELVADPDVDIVYVTTTHDRHHEHALLALRAGKPVLVEKPFTINAGQAREVVAEARSRGLFCMEAMWTRLDPVLRTAVDLAASGRIGTVLSVRADLSVAFAYDPAHRLFDLALGGGALLDLGVYPATVAWMFFGRPDEVQALGTLAPTGADLTVVQQWAYHRGVVAQLYCSSAGPSPFGGLVTGTDGWLGIEPDLLRPSRLLVHSGGHTEQLEAPAAPGNGYHHEIAEVERCLDAGRTESPAVPLDETVALLEVLDDVRRRLGVRYPAD
jgi:predicted dehydrogenase